MFHSLHLPSASGARARGACTGTQMLAAWKLLQMSFLITSLVTLLSHTKTFGVTEIVSLRVFLGAPITNRVTNATRSVAQ